MNKRGQMQINQEGEEVNSNWKKLFFGLVILVVILIIIFSVFYILKNNKADCGKGKFKVINGEKICVYPSVNTLCEKGYNFNEKKKVCEKKLESAVDCKGIFNKTTNICTVLINETYSCSQGVLTLIDGVWSCVTDINNTIINQTNSNQTQICSELNGNICSVDQTCSGNFINASDSNRCCSGQCINQTIPLSAELSAEFIQVLNNWPIESEQLNPNIKQIYSRGYYYSTLINEPNGLVLLSFNDPVYGLVYFAWSRSANLQSLNERLAGLFWSYVINDHGKEELANMNASNILVSNKGIILFPSANPSPVISSISVEGNSAGGRIEPIPGAYGDLWFSTWADDNNLYATWGDGWGFDQHVGALASNGINDIGVGRISGSLPNVVGEDLYGDVINAGINDDKPSSLLFIDGRLYGEFHTGTLGYLAYSDDYGITWTRVGFYNEGETPAQDSSPWDLGRNSTYKCLLFINMGKNYELNNDGYVYAFGMAREYGPITVHATGEILEGSMPKGTIYLARVPKDKILDYNSYQYLVGLENNQPQWSTSQFDARPIPGVFVLDQSSAIYHSGINRYLLFTSTDLYDAPNPWGPWTYAGSWNRPEKIGWLGAYQPGIISKDTGPNSFWFTTAGQPYWMLTGQNPPQDSTNYIDYKVSLGKIIMQLR